jgi:rubrerythrin
MSIVESLLRLVDPVQAKARDEERRVAREQPKREDAGDPPRFACRVCGTIGTEKAYCPECLADTMEPLTAKR